MPRVPEIPTTVSPLEALPNARFSVDAPLEAFGGGSGLEKVNEGFQGLGSSIVDIARSEKEKADQLAVMSASKDAMQLQTQLQIKAASMKGKDALGAADLVDKGWNDGVSKISQALSNDQQRMAFNHYASSAYGELYKSTQLHMSTQIREFDEQETKSLLDTSRNAAVLNSYDSERVHDELDKQHAALEMWASRNGIPTDSQQFKDRVQEAQSATAAAVIESRLTAGQDEAAQEFYKDHKPMMTAQDIVVTDRRIESTKTLQTSMDTWQKVKGFRLENGDPDEARMQASIMARDDLSNEQKLKVLDFVQSQAKIATYERRAQDAADERGLLNSALQARKDGQPLDQALKLVDNYAKDNEAEAVMKRQVMQIYAPPKPTREQIAQESDLANKLSDGIRDGSVDKSALNQLFIRGDLQQKNFDSLSAQLERQRQHGVSAEERNAWDKVKALATATYPKDSESQKNFLTTIRELGQGKNGDQIWELAQREIKDDPATKSGWIFTTYQPQWKTDMAKLNANSTAMGKVENDVGKSVMNAIGAGVLYQRATKGAGPAYPNTKWGVDDVNSFANAFGGYDQIKTGTPVNNAIQSLARHGQYATIENVKTMLAQHPDGVF